MTRIPIEEIMTLRCRMDRTGAEPLSQMEVLDALDGARYLLQMAREDMTGPKDRNILLEAINNLRDVADGLYGCLFGEDSE